MPAQYRQHLRCILPLTASSALAATVHEGQTNTQHALPSLRKQCSALATCVGSLCIKAPQSHTGLLPGLLPGHSPFDCQQRSGCYCT